MHRLLRKIARPLGATFLVVMGACAHAADVVEHSTSYGTPALPFTANFGQTYTFPGAPVPGDRFVDDYGFIVSAASFSSIVATFDLGGVFSIGDLSLRLFAGDPWSGALPGTLSAGDIAFRSANTIAMGSGSGSVELIGPTTLAPGHYVLEVSGLVTGSFGGSYGGVLNIVPVPEAPALPVTLAGALLIGFIVFRRRA